MDYYKWLTTGILITLAVCPLAASSRADQSSSSLGINVCLTTIRQWLWKAGELATLGLKDGSAVAQYNWVVNNIEDKIIKANYTQDITLSPPFYIDVPGNKARLGLYLYDRNTSSIGLYLVLMKGQFDDMVSWPFDKIYEFSSVGSDGSTFVIDPTDPSSDCNGQFDESPYNRHGCGVPEYFDIETLLSNKTSYLIDGALHINVTIYFDD